MKHVTIIAEIGINHQGDINKAKKMIDRAKEVGADIAKFQWYRPKDVLGKFHPALQEAEKAQFSEAQHRVLKEHCESVGIEWGCSVFHKDQIPMTENMGIKRYKIASRCAHKASLLMQIAKTRKPIILSTGRSKDQNLNQIRYLLKPAKNLTLLYCVCKYPTAIEDINLERIDHLYKFAPNVGFSSHCPDTMASIAAVARGATVIEHHVVLDDTQIGCDVPASITFDKLGELIKTIRHMEKMK